MNSSSVWQILRYILLAVGGYFVSKGTISNDNLVSIISGIGTLFVAVWGIYVKAGTTAVPDATAARPDVPTVSAATGEVTK